jgi:hypothetical protein
VLNDARAGDVRSANSMLTDEARLRGGEWGVRSIPGNKVVLTKRDASWEGSSDPELRLSYGTGGWRLVSGVLSFIDAKSPLAALKKLSACLLGADYEALLTLLPKGERTLWSPGALMHKLEESQVKPAWTQLAKLIERGEFRLVCVDGAGECVAKFSNTVDVSLRIEDGSWKVVDVEPFEKYIP